MKQLIFFSGLVAIFCCILNLTQGCQHSLQDSLQEEIRVRRQVLTEADATVDLRAYFTACMSFMVPDSNYDWSATVDYTVLESLWHVNTGQVYCSGAGGGSTRECWQEKIGGYLEPESILLAPARTCIAHYSEDEPLGLNRYAHLIRRGKRQLPRRHRHNRYDVILPRYAECIASDVPRISGIPNYEQLSFFIQNDTRDPCDSGPIESRTAPTWPYRFVALTRTDTRLRRQLQICGRQFFPSPSHWTSWSRYSVCGTKCRQSRSRTCRSGTNSRRLSDDCPGAPQESRDCTGGLCDNVQSWTRWSEWSPCIPPCDEGKQTKSRRCLFANNTEGVDCLGSRLETRSCRGNGRYSEWTKWDSCTTQCKQERVRICELNGAQFNVRPQERKCTGGRCATPDPQWSQWGSWDACSRSCGPGIQTRSRRCISFGASQRPNCRGASTDSRSCTERKITSWGNWGSCPTTCSRSRTRTCGSSVTARQTESCRGNACPRGYSWGRWLPFGACSSSCGGGRQVRRRHCILKALNNLRGNTRFCQSSGGRNTSNRACNTRPCPSWSSWSSYSRCRLPRGRRCGLGSQLRTRICRNSTRTARCRGLRNDRRPCTIRCIPIIR